MSPSEGEEAGRVVGGAVEFKGKLTVAKMKQLHLDIVESAEVEEDGILYTFPNHAIIPSSPIIFDDSDMEPIDE